MDRTACLQPPSTIQDRDACVAVPVSARSGTDPIRDNPATQHRIILQPNTGDPCLRRMIEENPFKAAAVVLANRMARTVWALSVRSDTYRADAAA